MRIIITILYGFINFDLHFKVNKRTGSDVDFHSFSFSDQTSVSYQKFQLPGTANEKILFLNPLQSCCILKSQKYKQFHCARKLISRFPENKHLELGTNILNGFTRD